ncbi:MAG: hypothetical protein SFV15_11165 [Polyangiaceae bacterium]|nr:hypothetical protein [Polyangiaceae bacterium]
MAKFRWALLGGGFLMLACTGVPAKAPAPHVASPKTPNAKLVQPVSQTPIVKLPSGAHEPITVKAVVRGARVASAFVGDWEISEVQLPVDWRATGDAGALSHVAVEGEEGAPFSFGVRGNGTEPKAGVAVNSQGDTLWLRRSRAHTANRLQVRLYTQATEYESGQIYTVEVEDAPSAPARETKKASTKPKPAEVIKAEDARAAPFFKKFLLALATYADEQPSDIPFFEAARDKLLKAATGNTTKPPRFRRTEPVLKADWQELMSLSTGLTSIDGALQANTVLQTDARKSRATIPLSELPPPRLANHDWPNMLRILGRTPPSETLAHATPKGFYYARAKQLDSLFQLLDEADTWITPALGLLERHHQSRDLVQRYQLALGLKRTQLTELFGPTLIEQVALVGRDPFFALGSDVSLLFKVKSTTAFGLALAQALRGMEALHGTATTTTTEHQGTSVTLTQTPDHAVHRFSAVLGDIYIVSNSHTAVECVLDTLQKRAPSLALEPDFRYMLARDATLPEDILLYAGEQFLADLVSPGLRILDARRKLARSEILGLSYASLTHAWAYGSLPGDAKELAARGFLQPSERTHFDRSSIELDTRKGPSSKWGNPSAMTPLIDLEPVKMVTTTEKQGYADFARAYENVWSDAIDPIALRIRFNGPEKARTLSAHLRVLPIIQDQDYREIATLVGTTRIGAAPLQSGFRALFAIAKDSELRRELDGSARDVLGQKLALKWVGDWALVGMADTTSVANTLQPFLRKKLTANDDQPKEMQAVFQLPLYAAIGIDSPALAALALGVAKQKITELGDGMVRLGADLNYRDQAISELQGPTGERAYLALTPHAFYLSLSLPTLKSLIDDEKSGKLPKSTRRASHENGQFFLELAGEKQGGLFTSLLWALDEWQGETPDFSRERAFISFAAFNPGYPNDVWQLTNSYLGAVPLTRDGRNFLWTKEGVSDPVRGTANRPVWPPLPVANSALDRILSSLRAIRTSISFEPEASPNPERPERSLAVTVDVKRAASDVAVDVKRAGSNSAK